MKNSIKEILAGDFVEFIAWFADGSTASLSEFDGIHSFEEAQQRATRISLAEARGAVVRVFRAK